LWTDWKKQPTWSARRGVRTVGAIVDESASGLNRACDLLNTISISDNCINLWGMTYVIGTPCVDIKDRACVDGCPDDCIYEGARMPCVHPHECVDSGACEPVRSVAAIFYEDDLRELLRRCTEEKIKFFTYTLAGQTHSLGSTGGAAKVDAVTPMAAALPPQVR
jgi:NAD-dependent dihydropyrimidine dehydrogenase PreA subunit